MFTKLYIYIVAIWKTIFSKTETKEPSTTIININLKSELSESDHCYVDYNYNTY